MVFWVAMNGESEMSRDNAVKRLLDESELEAVVRREMSRPPKPIITTNFTGSSADPARTAVKKISDQKILAGLAKIGAPGATEKVTDQRVLAELAEGHDDPKHRHEALWKLTDEEVLARIARNDKEPGVRELATKRLKRVIGKSIAISPRRKELYDAYNKEKFHQDRLRAEGVPYYGSPEYALIKARFPNYEFRDHAKLEALKAAFLEEEFRDERRRNEEIERELRRRGWT